jgi:histidyl-tRNA synthetase
MKYVNQIGYYEMVKIVNAYLNKVKIQFGNKVQVFLNLLLKKNGGTEKEIAATIKTIIEQISNVKLAISSRNIEDMTKKFFSSNDLNIICNLFDSYSMDYRFAKGLIYYDCKANHLKHIKAYYRLSSMCKALQNKSFNCFPLRKGLIPSYMTIDTYIINTQVLKNSIISHLDKEVVWEPF